MFKKYVTLSAVLLCGIAAFAQTNQSNEQLELPDVTTVIDSENLKANRDALPDFKNVLEVSGDSGTVTVQLPDVDNQDTQVEVKTAKENSEKSIFAEGMIGGGYPFLFMGDFSVFRQTGDNPFKINFNHEASAGYSGHALNDGFFDSSTSMELQKKLTHNNFEWNVEGAYNNWENGLQNLGGDVSSINQNVIGGKTDFTWNLPKGHALGLSVEAKDYIRYASASNTAALADWVKQTQVFSLVPAAWYAWEGYGFKTGVNAEYSLDAFNGVLNRGLFTGNFSWENKYVKLYSDVGVAVSNKMNSAVAVPFTLGVTSSIPVKFATRNLAIGTEFGISSERADIAAIEQKYKFTGFKELAGETSFWYGKVDFVLPVKNAFTASVNVTYKKTAFGNGIYSPDYFDSALTNGLYGYSQQDVQLLYTGVELSYFYGMFSASLDLFGNFLDIPVTENQIGCALNLSVLNPNGKWGVDGSFAYMFNNTPEVGISGFLRISPAVKLIAQLDDIIYMVKPSEYRYYGYHVKSAAAAEGFSQYIERNGSATIALKFNF